MRVTKASLAGNSFETKACVGTCIHVNYLLVVQQEMRNDNKLGKEKQKNKQIVSLPLLHLLLSFLLVSFL